MVNASIRINNSDAFVFSVNEYVTTGKSVLFCINLRTSFLAIAASAHLKQVHINTASASFLPSTRDIALAIINLRLELAQLKPNFS